MKTYRPFQILFAVIFPVVQAANAQIGTRGLQHGIPPQPPPGPMVCDSIRMTTVKSTPIRPRSGEFYRFSYWEQKPGALSFGGPITIDQSAYKWLVLPPNPTSIRPSRGDDYLTLAISAQPTEKVKSASRNFVPCVQTIDFITFGQIELSEFESECALAVLLTLSFY